MYNLVYINMVSNSDISAKDAFKIELSKKGYKDIRTIKEPADIEAWKDGERFFFEIKSTTKEKYFGAATLTEWNAAYMDPKHYFFVICQKQVNDSFLFWQLSPEELEVFSTIPPFKFFFNISLPYDENILKQEKEKKKRAVRLNRNKFDILNKLYARIKNEK